MPIAFPCENCGHRYEVADSLAGKKCRCKKCGRIFAVPVPRQSAYSAPNDISSQETASKPKKSRNRPKATSPVLDADDPYGFDEAPLPSPPRGEIVPRAAEEPRAGQDVRPLAFKPRKIKKTSGESFLRELAGWIYLGGLGLLVLLVVGAFFSPEVASVLGFLALGAGVLGLIVGACGMIVTPFRESAACGLMCVFVPFYGLYYTMTRWRVMGVWFLTYLGGAAALVCALVPAVFAARDAALRARQRNQMGQVGAPAPGRPADVEANTVEFIRTAQSLCDLTAGVVDVPSAQAASSRFAELVARINEIDGGGSGDPIAAAGVLQRMPLRGKYGAELSRVNALWDAEIQRIKATPSVQAALVSQLPAALSAARFSGQGRGFGGNPGYTPTDRALAPPFVPPSATDRVTLNITGLVDKDTADAFYDKLVALSKRLNNGNGGRSSNGSGGHDICVVWPVKDVQGFADAITFAKVTRVEGRTIDVVVSPLPAGERRPADGDFADQVIFDLRSPSLQRRQGALTRLQNAPPEPSRRQEVSRAVEPMLRDPGSLARSDAAKALKVWGGPENTPALMGALNDPQSYVSGAVLDAIKKIHDPSAASAVAARLTDPVSRTAAADALKAMGPDAQSEVVKYLNHADLFVRADACKILAAIGTTDETRLAVMAVWFRADGRGLDAMADDDTIRRIGKPQTASPFKKKSIVPR